MKIRIEPHTLLRANERGVTLESGLDLLGKKGKIGKCMVFDFKKTRNGKFYEEKKLEVFYLIEMETIVTVTVYVFYGKFNL